MPETTVDGAGHRASLLFSLRGEAKCVRGPLGRGVGCLARAGVLEQYIEHGKQAATKSWRSYRVLRPSGGEKCRLAARFPKETKCLVQETNSSTKAKSWGLLG